MKITKQIPIVILLILLISCNDYINDNPNKSTIDVFQKNNGKALLKVDFDLTSYVDYEIPEGLSKLDYSLLNPNSEKQQISMQLFEDGQMHITLENINFEQQIHIDHQTPPDKSDKIVKTIISNNIANFYGSNGKLIASENIPMPNHIDMVNKIKEIGENFSINDINNMIATMQGQAFVDNLADFIANASQYGVTVLAQGNNFVTLQMPLSNIDARMKQDAVLLINTQLNKLVGSRIYDENNEIIQSVFYGYNTGEVQSLNAILKSQKIVLPSGITATMLTNSKIENVQFSLN